MYKISELISMPIISIYDSTECGIISNILFDTKRYKCKYFIILDDSKGILQIINIKDIIKIGQNCIFIKNKTNLELFNNFEKNFNKTFSLINMKTYEITGKFYGKSTDIELDENLQIINIILDETKKITVEKIFSIGNIIILDENKTFNKKTLIKYRPRKVIPKSQKNNIVTTQTKQLETNLENPLPNKKNNKIITDYHFLLGRIIKKNILTQNGEIIAKQGETINKELVKQASIYGKLVEIARYSQ